MISRKIHTLSKDKNKQDKRSCSNCFYLDQLKKCTKHKVYKECGCCSQYENRTYKLFADSIEAFSRLFLPCILLIMVGIVWRILNY